MRTGIIGTRDKVAFTAGKLGKRSGEGGCLLYLRRIVGRSEQYEVVGHHGDPLGPMACRDKFLFILRGMGQQQIGIAAAAEGEGGPTADRHDLHLNPGILFKLRDQLLKQTTIPGTGGGGQREGPRGIAAPGTGDRQQNDEWEGE